jgi:predicted Fe-S protein YdhL (DUF1289 family)
LGVSGRGAECYSAIFTVATNDMTAPDNPSAKPLRSPCINVCQVSGRTAWCEGCFRSLKEIAGWRRMTEGERDTVLADLPRRRALAQATARSSAG